MAIEHDFDRSLKFGLKAMKLSRSKGIPLTPRNFELLYNFVASDNQPLAKAVGQELERSGSLSDAVARQIHDKYLSPTRQADSIEEIGSELSGEISQAMSLIGDAAGSSGAYSESLEGISAKISDADSVADLKSVVQTLAVQSRDMERKSRDLELKLNESQEHIAALNDRINDVRKDSRTDALTGIANRKCFDEALEAEIAAADLSNAELCLCVGDVDRFKSFNDTYGHQTGDHVLRLVAGALASNVKGHDVAARYGGEEFAIILPETDLQAAVIVADRIRKLVMAKELVKKSTGENLGTITMSFGVSRYRSGESAEDLIQRADICLYAAKNGGRNQVKSEDDPGVDIANVA